MALDLAKAAWRADFVEEWNSWCVTQGAGYPCGENPINIVSLSLACSGLALLMVSLVLSGPYL